MTTSGNMIGSGFQLEQICQWILTSRQDANFPSENHLKSFTLLSYDIKGAGRQGRRHYVFSGDQLVLATRLCNTAFTYRSVWKIAPFPNISSPSIGRPSCFQTEACNSKHSCWPGCPLWCSTFWILFKSLPLLQYHEDLLLVFLI